MKFCPNCGAKLPTETVKFCPECGFKLAGAVEAPAPAPATPTAVQPREPQTQNQQAFELLKTEISKNASSLSKNIVDEVLEKWKPCRACPESVGRAINVIAEQALPSAVGVAVSSAVWQNEQSIETDGHWDTSVSTIFPVKFDTHVPLVGKVHIDEVKLTVKGSVDTDSNSVTDLRIGSINL